MSEIQNLQSKKYILLETYKKNKQGIKTPVWFVTNNDLIYVITRDKTGKVKRLKNNPSVKFTPCTFLGKPKGEWILGDAKFVSGDEFQKALELRRKKYGIMDIFARLASRKKGNLVVISIKQKEP